MLRLLRIRNLAVIEAVEVEFEPGFNVLTGETGAGKSILVEAVGLLLGARASADLVRTGEGQATIEAIFEDAAEGELIIRREVTSQGRSRSFVNGTLATAAPFATWPTGWSSFTGSTSTRRCSIRCPTCRWWTSGADSFPCSSRSHRPGRPCGSLRELRDRARMDGREKAARLDLIAFQLGEIEKAALKPAEDEELATTRQVLANAERVQRLCEESYATLYDSDQAVLTGLAQVWKRVAELAAIEPRFADQLEARDSIKSQLEDMAFLLRRYADDIDASPGRLQQVEDRLALIERLKRKYGPTLQDVIATGRGPGGRARAADAIRGGGRRSRSGPRRREGAISGAGPGAVAPPPDSWPGTSRSRSRRIWASWRWRGPGSRCASTRRSPARRRGATAGSIRPSSSCPRTSGRIFGRSRGSCPAASCHGLCWR